MQLFIEAIRTEGIIAEEPRQLGISKMYLFVQFKHFLQPILKLKTKMKKVLNIQTTLSKK